MFAFRNKQLEKHDSPKTLKHHRGDGRWEASKSYLGVEMIDGLLVQLIEYLGRCGLIHLAPIDIGVAIAPDILHDPLVLWTASCELSSVDGKRVAVLGVGYFPLVVLDLVLEEFLERLVLVDNFGAGDTEARYPRLVACIRTRVDRRRVVIAANGIFLDGQGGFEDNLLIFLGDIRRIECLF
jgi:hypothetical protein